MGSSHGVAVYTVNGWCERFLQRRFEADLLPAEWLAYPEQMFLLVTAGQVFRDDFGELRALRQRFSYYPRDVWLFRLAAQWRRIAEERAYAGRAGDAGDTLGSQVISARMVEHIMRLAMLVERRYAPYAKWFGSAFSQLDCAPELSITLNDCLSAASWQAREAAITESCGFLADLQLAKGVPGAIYPELSTIYDRPYRFIDSLKISDALFAMIEDEDVKSLNPLGGPDQYLTSNYILAVPALTEAGSKTLLSASIR